MKNLKKLILIAVIAVLFNSCAKDGATGPAGPAGSNGNANVTSSTFTVTSWLSNSSCWYTDLTVPTLTSAVQSKGSVSYTHLTLPTKRKV